MLSCILPHPLPACLPPLRRSHVPNIREARLIGDVIDQEDAHRSSIVRRRDRPKSLLTCGVPYLQLDLRLAGFGIGDEDGLDLEIDADRGDEGRRVRVIRVSQEEAGLAHSCRRCRSKRKRG